eukprot:238021_1
MATLLLFLFSCIVSSNAQVEDAGYIWIKSISDSRLSDYEGIYSKDDCGGDCGCNTGCCGAQYGGWVSPQHVYKKIHPSGDMYLYKEATGIDATFTPAGDMWVPLLITLKDGRTGNCPNWQNNEYVLKYPLHYDHLALWQNASGSDWSDTTGTSVTVDICTSEQPSCATSSPTNVPSSQPSSSPSENPSRSPSDQPTNQPTPAPTAPRVKYQFCKELTTFVQTDFKICLFISSDPMGDSVVRISMSGPNDRSWMVFFAETAPLAYGETASNANADQYLDFFNNKASGYVVNPTDTNAPAGEIFIDQTSGYTYMDYSTYDQNSNITLDVNYKSDQALATVERQLFTNDAEDWEFTFAHLLDQFYICFVAQQSGQINFGVTNDKDCTDELNPDGYTYNREQIEGNYGLRASWEFDPFAIYMEYNPFTGVYNGQCTKPKDAWILWGRYYANPVDATTGSMWNGATFCDTEKANTKAGFASLLHADPRVLTKPSSVAQVWRIGIDDLGDTHRINFTVNATDLDGGGATGWDTSHFFLTELLQFNVFYYLGSTTKMKTDFSAKNELFANGSAVLDYVTAAPTLAPTNAPSLAPSQAPSLAPSSAPSSAPSLAPSLAPSAAPSLAPSNAPSNSPSGAPSMAPSVAPSLAPSNAPSLAPSNAPSLAPSSAPTPEIKFCFGFCLSEDYDGDDDTTFIQAQVLETLNAQTNVDDFLSITLEEVDPSTLDNTVTGSICYEACVPIIGFTESERWLLLQDVNNAILEFRTALATAFNADNPQLPTAMTYGAAEDVLIDPYCLDIPYPRVCRTSVLMDTYELSLGVNTDDETVHFQLCHGDGNAYFGIGFGADAMDGNGVVYTTGKDDSDTAGVYDYTFASQAAAGVTKNTGSDVVFGESMMNGLFCVNFSKNVDDIVIELAVTAGNAGTVDLWYAKGDALQLTIHGVSNRGSTSLELVPSPESSDLHWCGNNAAEPCTLVEFDDDTDEIEDSLCGETGVKRNDPAVVDDFTVVFVLNCVTEMLLVNITYPDYDDNWFGFVFGKKMFGDALVWTTGKDGDRPLGLYAYENTNKKVDGSGVEYTPSKNWNEYGVTRRRLAEGGLNIVYETDLPKGFGDITADESVIGFRWAKGNALQLNYHESHGTYHELNMDTGELTEAKEVVTITNLKYAHASLMFLAWTICCSVGIISSAARFIYGTKDKGMWFKVHRVVQILVIVFCLAGFVIAIVFTNDMGNMHFDSLHKQLGLVVTIIAVFQPLNALIRPDHVEVDEEKPVKRLVWEIVHKLFGYSGWILSQVVIYLGAQMVFDNTVQIIALVCSGLVVVIYLVLWLVKCMRSGAADHVSTDEPSLDKVASVDGDGVEMGATTTQDGKEEVATTKGGNESSVSSDDKDKTDKGDETDETVRPQQNASTDALITTGGLDEEEEEDDDDDVTFKI